MIIVTLIVIMIDYKKVVIKKQMGLYVDYFVKVL